MNLIAIGLAAVLAAVLVPISTPAYAAEVAADITIGSSTKRTDAYSPNLLEINVGDTVTWTNKDSQPHTVTSGSDAEADGRFDSSPGFDPLILSQATFSHTFAEAGEFPYFCWLHPNMVGTVIVSSGIDDGNTGEQEQIPFLVFAAILAIAIAGIIGYTRFARKDRGLSGKA